MNPIDRATWEQRQILQQLSGYIACICCGDRISDKGYYGCFHCRTHLDATAVGAQMGDDEWDYRWKQLKDSR